MEKEKAREGESRSVMGTFDVKRPKDTAEGTGVMSYVKT